MPSFSLQKEVQQLDERARKLQEWVQDEQKTANEHLQKIADYLKRKDKFLDELENVRKYKNRLETEVQNFTKTLMQIPSEMERMNKLLQQEQETVKNQTARLDAYLKEKNGYVHDLDLLRKENTRMGEVLKNLTEAVEFKKAEDVQTGLMAIEMFFRELFKAEDRVTQWTKFYELIERMAVHKDAIDPEAFGMMMNYLKTPPADLIKDMKAYFDSAETFGRTVDQFYNKLTDDINSYIHNKPRSDDQIPVAMSRAVEIILKAFFSPDQIKIY